MKAFLSVLALLISASSAMAFNTALGENSRALNLIKDNKAYLSLVQTELKKADTVDVGDAGMRAILISASYGETTVERYLILREFFQGHGGPSYSMSTLVDIGNSSKILKITPVDLIK